MESPAYLELLERLIQTLKRDCHFGHLYFYRDRMLEACTRAAQIQACAGI